MKILSVHFVMKPLMTVWYVRMGMNAICARSTTHLQPCGIHTKTRTKSAYTLQYSVVFSAKDPHAIIQQS